jgi:hypothetical protein
MGGKATKEVLTKIADGLEKGQGVDQKVLQELFAKYDADKNGFLEELNRYGSSINLRFCNLRPLHYTTLISLSLLPSR